MAVLIRHQSAANRMNHENTEETSVLAFSVSSVVNVSCAFGLQRKIFPACFAAMQKLIVMMMSMVLLMISSMPMAIGAANCPPPAHEAAMAVDDLDAHDIQLQDEHVQHDHDVALAGDWQHDRIECGCGCHNSIDSLPQLLAPHMTSDIIQLIESLSVSVPARIEMVWQTSAVRVPLPPPQYLILS